MLAIPIIFLWYMAHMAARPVQISIDAALLRRVDRDPEARKAGRSAFIRSAIELYLAAKDRRDTDEAIRRAYGGRAGELAAEVEDLMEAQTWPAK